MMPAAQRFEFWRAIHTFVDLDTADHDRRNDLRADLLLHIAPDGATFGHVSSDDLITRFARSGDEYVLFSLGLSGMTRIRTDRDAAWTVTPASGVVVMDGTRPMTTATENHSHVYLTVPKSRLLNVLGQPPDLLRDGLFALPAQGLAGLLASHLLAIARQGHRLDRPSTAAAMKAAVELAVATLACARDEETWPDPRHDDAFYAAARRHIELHPADPGLTSAAIAHALGCSRAHLYRIFARHDQAVGDVIRAERLAHAASLLAAPRTLPVEQIAIACGFANPSAFTRAFRAWHGLTPTAFRDRSRER